MMKSRYSFRLPKLTKAGTTSVSMNIISCLFNSIKELKLGRFFILSRVAANQTNWYELSELLLANSCYTSKPTPPYKNKSLNILSGKQLRASWLKFSWFKRMVPKVWTLSSNSCTNILTTFVRWLKDVTSDCFDVLISSDVAFCSLSITNSW